MKQIKPALLISLFFAQIQFGFATGADCTHSFSMIIFPDQFVSSMLPRDWSTQEDRSFKTNDFKQLSIIITSIDNEKLITFNYDLSENPNLFAESNYERLDYIAKTGKHENGNCLGFFVKAKLSRNFLSLNFPVERMVDLVTGREHTFSGTESLSDPYRDPHNPETPRNLTEEATVHLFGENYTLDSSNRVSHEGILYNHGLTTSGFDIVWGYFYKNRVRKNN